MITLVDKLGHGPHLFRAGTLIYREALKQEFVIQVDKHYMRTLQSTREQITGEPNLGWEGWLVRGGFLAGGGGRN